MNFYNEFVKNRKLLFWFLNDIVKKTHFINIELKFNNLTNFFVFFENAM